MGLASGRQTDRFGGLSTEQWNGQSPLSTAPGLRSERFHLPRLEIQAKAEERIS